MGCPVNCNGVTTASGPDPLPAAHLHVIPAAAAEQVHAGGGRAVGEKQQAATGPHATMQRAKCCLASCQRTLPAGATCQQLVQCALQQQRRGGHVVGTAG